MMPFVMTNSGFNYTKLPKYVKQYWQMIRSCLEYDTTQEGKIGYLTIQESTVEPNKSQRRPGLHIETPGMVTIGGNSQLYIKGGGDVQIEQHTRVTWGGGSWTYDVNKPKDGIYMASNVDHSCAMWNANIKPNDTGDEIIGALGNMEHVRHLLGKPNILMSNTLYWFTDRTPHESLILKKKKRRQYFRLVTHPVSVWYAEHSTPNPNGVLPDPNETKIIQGNKFIKKPVNLWKQKAKKAQLNRKKLKKPKTSKSVKSPKPSTNNIESNTELKEPESLSHVTSNNDNISQKQNKMKTPDINETNDPQNI